MNSLLEHSAELEKIVCFRLTPLRFLLLVGVVRVRCRHCVHALLPPLLSHFFWLFRQLFAEVTVT